MKIFSMICALAVLVPLSPTSAEDISSTARIRDDPKTIKEFTDIVRRSIVDGAVKVVFPSGEWNWYCTCMIIPADETAPSVWSITTQSFKPDELHEWIVTNSIITTAIVMSEDCDPSLFFKTESILRERKVIYWVHKNDELSDMKNHIRLTEVTGTMRVVADDGCQHNE